MLAAGVHLHRCGRHISVYGESQDPFTSVRRYDTPVRTAMPPPPTPPPNHTPTHPPPCPTAPPASAAFLRARLGQRPGSLDALMPWAGARYSPHTPPHATPPPDQQHSSLTPPPIRPETHALLPSAPPPRTRPHVPAPLPMPAPCRLPATASVPLQTAASSCGWTGLRSWCGGSTGRR